MNQDGFRKFYWGFLFIMVDFRLQGIDVLPDIIGYILFASGFSILAANSMFFSKASTFNIPMIILSIFDIYQRPLNQGYANNVSLPLVILVLIANIVFSLLTVYNLFEGVRDMAYHAQQGDIYEEADKRWTQFLLLHLAGLLLFVLFIVPPIALLYGIGMFIAGVALTIKIMGLMKKCEYNL